MCPAPLGTVQVGGVLPPQMRVIPAAAHCAYVLLITGSAVEDTQPRSPALAPLFCCPHASR